MGKSKKQLRDVNVYGKKVKYASYYDDFSDDDSYDMPTHNEFSKLAALSTRSTHYVSGLSQGACNNASTKRSKMTEPMKPRNPNQAKYISLMENKMPYIVIATGPAGTAKSSLAVSVGIQELLKHNYEKIVITRPMVAVSEEVGFLPGGIEDKMDPWMRPLYDTFYKYYTPDQVKTMIANKIIDICPIAYLRGRTLEDSFIIIDEAQNCNITQMLMILTRIGQNSKMVITGDPMQHDRGREKSGLTDLIEKLYNRRAKELFSIHDLDDEDKKNDPIKGIEHIAFNEGDVERHPVIKDILKLYKNDDLKF